MKNRLSNIQICKFNKKSKIKQINMQVSNLENMRDNGVFSQADVEEQWERIRANIEKNIESNKPHAMLLMEMDRGKRKTNNDDKFVSLTEIAKQKNFKNPSYVIQSWLRDRNTLDVLFEW